MKGFGRLLVTNGFNAGLFSGGLFNEGFSDVKFLDVKFLYVVICFFIALGSYFFCHSKRDWAWLAGGMAFTVGADYFLVLYNAHLYGIAVFCFAHICYAFRAWDAGRNLRLRWVRSIFLIMVLLVAVCVVRGNVAMLAVMYASWFATSILLHIKNRRVMKNATLILAGLIFFAFCDVFVLLYNVPLYFGVLPWLQRVYRLIWVFYLPSQVLRAVSALRFNFTKKAPCREVS